MVRQLKARGHVSRGYLGIQLQELDADLARMLGIGGTVGTMVLDVVEGNAGEAAGLKRYDVITSVSGTAIEDGDHLVRVIAAQAPGSEVALQVVRDRRPITLTARLSERGAILERPPLGEPARVSAPGAGDRLGLVVGELSPEMHEELRLPDELRGVAVTSVVGLSGLEQLVHGDLVLEVNRQPTPDLAAYRRVVAALRAGRRGLAVRAAPAPRGHVPGAHRSGGRHAPMRTRRMKPKVLIVDDEEAIRSTMKMMFEYEGYDCVLAAGGEAGAQDRGARAARPRLPRHQDAADGRARGAEAAASGGRLAAGRDPVRPRDRAHRGRGHQAGRVRLHREAARDRAHPAGRAQRAASSGGCSARRRGFRESQDARYRMVGESPALEKVRDAITRAAPTNATVLILGESGVGKELVARAIHRNSPRKDEAFVQVNCAAIPEELIESELFGHEKGSFTGAAEKQIGKFELAHKGTIFLDEIGDMSLRTQAKVLRVLQEGEVERIGSQKTIQVDVRVIAATNKTLEEAIETGEFREDLYFRLSVIPIRVPPLRERQRGHRRRWSSTSCRRSRPTTTSGPRPSRPRPWRCCARTPGAATCASCATPSSAC